MKDMKEQIDKLGTFFRGLWKSYIFETEDSFAVTEKWSVTFICGGHYVETPYLDTAEEALAYAIRKLYHEL